MLWDKMKPILEGFSKEYNLPTFQWTARARSSEVGSFTSTKNEGEVIEWLG